MYFLLILFFSSLIGITLMISRKLILLQSGQVSYKEDIHFREIHLEEWKDIIIKNTKKYGFITLVAIIRFYVQTSNFLKNNYEKIKTELKNIYSRKLNENPAEKREVNKFLRLISEYKLKLRLIKEKVKEEEGL